MKIIFVTSEGERLAGARIRCCGFAEQLRRYGVKTEVLSFGDNLGAKYAEEESTMSSFEKMRLVCGAFKRLSAQDRDSIFYIQRFNYHAFAPFLMHLLKRGRMIFDMDDWDMRENPVYHFGFFPSSKAEFLTRILAKRSIFCVAASAYLCDYLKRFNERVLYVPTGVDSDIFKPAYNANGKETLVFSWVGTVYHKEMLENILFLIDCFCRLLELCGERCPAMLLEIAGEGRFFKDIGEEINRRKMAGKIILKGWIDPRDIPFYLEHVDIGLLPMIQDTRFNRSKSPTKLFEYMASGKPVVVSRLGEAARIIHDDYNGFTAKDKDEFIEKMRILVVDRKTRLRLAQASRATIEENYSLQILGKRIYGALQNL